MSSVFKVSPLNDKNLQEYRDKAMKSLNDFFNREWIYNTPKVFIVDDRKTIDLLREQETKSWIAGWSWGTLAVFILNPENVTKESSLSEDYDFEKLIKHELCHAFFQLTLGKSNFMWIEEGVCDYVSDRLGRYEKPKEFGGFLDGENVYQESGYVIEIIMENFGKEKLFEFLRKQSGVENKEKLNEVFKKVFGDDLSYKFFNDLKNS